MGARHPGSGRAPVRPCRPRRGACGVRRARRPACAQRPYSGASAWSPGGRSRSGRACSSSRRAGERGRVLAKPRNVKHTAGPRLVPPGAIHECVAGGRVEGPGVGDEGARERRVAGRRSQRARQARRARLPARALAAEARDQLARVRLRAPRRAPQGLEPRRPGSDSSAGPIKRSTCLGRARTAHAAVKVLAGAYYTGTHQLRLEVSKLRLQRALALHAALVLLLPPRAGFHAWASACLSSMSASMSRT